MTSIIIFLLGLAIGAAIAYLYFRGELIREKTIAEQTGLSEQKIKDQFSLLAQDILNKMACEGKKDGEKIKDRVDGEMVTCPAKIKNPKK